MRSWLVRRKTMEAALEGQRGLYDGLLCEKEREIVRLREEVAALRILAEFNGDSAMRQRAELARLREHFEGTVKAKDEAYRTLASSTEHRAETLNGRLDRAIEMLASYGHVQPFDWTAPLPPTLNAIVAADIHGVRGEVGGMGGDPGGDDPRYNTALAMGLGPCPIGAD